MRFEIRVDSRERLVEVTYPDSPSSLETADYILRMKRVMDQLDGGWYCLVDQRGLRSMSPALLEQVMTLNRYALKRGMLRSARLVEGAVAALQARRIHDETDAAVRTFTRREDAIAWLKQPG